MLRVCRSAPVVVVVVGVLVTLVGGVLGEVGGGDSGGARRRASTLPFTTTTTATEGQEGQEEGQRAKLLVPDLARVDSGLLKESQADKFLSLWFIYVLADPVHTSNEPWTLLIPKNEGLPRGGGFLTEKAATVDALLNHVVLGELLQPPSASAAGSSAGSSASTATTLRGTPIAFSTDEDGAVTVNGVRLTGEEHRFKDGVVYILESALPSPSSSPSSSLSPLLPTRLEGGEEEEVVPLEGLGVDEPVVVKKEGGGGGGGGNAATTTRLPPLTHRFATFKPRRRPASPAAAPSRPAAPRKAVLQPVLGEEPLGPAEADPLEPEFTSAGSGSGGLFEEVDLGLVEGSAALPSPPSARENEPFLPSFLSTLQASSAFTAAEFLHHFRDANITNKFRDAGRYTALVPHDAAFYSYYPIDWGFNPFLVHNFTQDVLLNHFVRGNIALDTLPALAELTTLGGRSIKFTRKGGKLLANGVPVSTESEQEVSRGRIFFIDELLFVDYDRVFELQSQYGDLETAPLLGNPWPSSQFLSHLLGWLEEQPQTSFFAEYLNLTNLAYLVPGHDEDLEPLKYTAFIPVDEAMAAFLDANGPDPFLVDEGLRDYLILGHLVSGRLYQDDLKAATTLTTLANTTLTVTVTPEGEVEVDGVRVLTPHTFLYNLGNVYLLDGLLGVTDGDIVHSINEFPHLDSGKDSTRPELIRVEEDPATSPAPSTLDQPPAPPPTTTTTTTTTTTRAPFTRTTTTSTTTPRTLRIATLRPRPRPSPTTPRIRFETRTEISISKRVNDGALETVDNFSS